MKNIINYLVRKLTPLKEIRFAFRKDKGTFISGAKENNSCDRGCELDGRGIAPIDYPFIVCCLLSGLLGYCVYGIAFCR